MALPFAGFSWPTYCTVAGLSGPAYLEKYSGLVMEKLLLGYKGFVLLPQLCVQGVQAT